jgi:nitric oxide reductase activation protein
MSNIHYVKVEDVEEWATLCGKFKQERDEARYKLENTKQSLEFAIEEINALKAAIRETLEENRHLADGDDCTLRKLKTAVEDWE